MSMLTSSLIFSHFNSRPSARGDLSRCGKCAARRHFNSRPSARGDVNRCNSFPNSLISIHAPPRGATIAKLAEALQIEPFQFTPLREGRRAGSGGKLRRYLFQFTPLREGRHDIQSSIHEMRQFQFTPLREGRPPVLTFIWSCQNFNSRPSARGDSFRFCVRL